MLSEMNTTIHKMMVIPMGPVEEFWHKVKRWTLEIMQRSKITKNLPIFLAIQESSHRRWVRQNYLEIEWRIWSMIRTSHLLTMGQLYYHKAYIVQNVVSLFIQRIMTSSRHCALKSINILMILISENYLSFPWKVTKEIMKSYLLRRILKPLQIPT